MAVTEKVPSLGRILGKRREQREDISQEDIASALGFVQSYISKLERGGLDKAMQKWKPDRIWTMLKAYRYNDDEARDLAEQFNLDIPYEHLLAPTGVGRFAVDDGALDSETFVVVTSASAGSGEPEIVEGITIPIPKHLLRARGIQNKSEVQVVKVNGDCLVSQSVRFSAKNIAHGDFAFVHIGAPPQDGDRICCYDHTDDQLIIKFWQEQRDPDAPDQIILYDARGITYVRSIADLDYRGVVFGRVGS